MALSIIDYRSKILMISNLRYPNPDLQVFYVLKIETGEIKIDYESGKDDN